MQSALFRTKCEGIRLCEAGVVAAVPACFCRLPPVRMRAGRKGRELFSPPVGRADGSPCFRRASIAGSFFSLLAGRSDGSPSLRAVRPVWHAQLRKKQSAIFADCFSAERTRFELVVRVHPVRRFSKPVVSATHPPLRATFPGPCAGFPHGARRTHALSKGCANIASFRENAKKTDEISRISLNRCHRRLHFSARVCRVGGSFEFRRCGRSVFAEWFGSALSSDTGISGGVCRGMRIRMMRMRKRAGPRRIRPGAIGRRPISDIRSPYRRSSADPGS